MTIRTSGGVGASCPVQGCLTYAKSARGMYDHLNASHGYEDLSANEAVASLSGQAAWGPVRSFSPRRPVRPTRAEDMGPAARAGQTVKPRPPTPPEESWEELVDYLIEIVHVIHRDRHIPKYQFERHVDSLLVPFLPEILAQRLGGTFQVVASEFPLKKLDNNQSTNADALLHQRNSAEQPDTWWLFELKTDPQSVSADQLQPYARACDRCMQDLVDDLETIAHASKAKLKYPVVRDLLSAAGASFDAAVRLVYLSPRPVPQLEKIPGSIGIVFEELLDLELESRPAAWRLVRDHLLAPVVGR